jgi:hypothetical protein
MNGDAVCGVNTATATVIRGEFRFSILVSARTMASAGAHVRGTCASAFEVQVAVWHDGRRIAAGTLEPLAPEYRASLRYRLKFQRSKSKPVGRIDDVMIGPDAWNALQSAIEAATMELRGACAGDSKERESH